MMLNLSNELALDQYIQERVLISRKCRDLKCVPFSAFAWFLEEGRISFPSYYYFSYSFLSSCNNSKRTFSFVKIRNRSKIRYLMDFCQSQSSCKVCCVLLLINRYLTEYYVFQGLSTEINIS